MKKIMTLAAMFAAVAMTFSACQPEDNPGNGGGNTCPDCGEDPCVCEDEFVSAIKIDGDYSDWAALDQTKVASCTGNADYPNPGLKALKVYADAVYIHAYIEYDMEFASTNNTAIHFYVNSDNDTATGGYDDAHLSPDCDFMLEGRIYSNGEVVSFDPGMFLWCAPTNDAGWAGFDGSWDPSFTPDESNLWGADLVEGSGAAQGTGGDGKYELSIMRMMLPGVTWNDTFTLGIDMSADWATVGVLPNTAPGDEAEGGDPNGRTDKLTVVIDK